VGRGRESGGGGRVGYKLCAQWARQMATATLTIP